MNASKHYNTTKTKSSKYTVFILFFFVSLFQYVPIHIHVRGNEMNWTEYMWAKINGLKIYIWGTWWYIYLFYFCQWVSTSKFVCTQKRSVKIYFKYDNKNKKNHDGKNAFNANPKSSPGLKVWFCKDDQHIEIYSKLIMLWVRIFFEKRQHHFMVLEQIFNSLQFKKKSQEKGQCYKWMLKYFSITFAREGDIS